MRRSRRCRLPCTQKRLLSERHPLLYQVSVWEKRIRRTLSWYTSSKRFTRQRDNDPLPFRVKKHQSKLIKKLGGPKRLQVCYEAGPCGYVLYWQLVQLGVACEVIAPTLDRSRRATGRDAIKLANRGQSRVMLQTENGWVDPDLTTLRNVLYSKCDVVVVLQGGRHRAKILKTRLKE